MIKSEIQTRFNFEKSHSEILVLQGSVGKKLLKIAKSSDNYLKKQTIRIYFDLAKPKKGVSFVFLI